MIASVALQEALFKKLSLGAYPVFEIVPSDISKMPFITFGDLGKQNDFTKTNKDRFTFSITIHGWSVGKSSSQIKQIEEFIYQTIMNITTESYDVEFVDLVMNANTKQEETADKVIFQSIQQFQITISKKGE